MVTESKLIGFFTVKYVLMYFTVEYVLMYFTVKYVLMYFIVEYVLMSNKFIFKSLSKITELHR